MHARGFPGTIEGAADAEAWVAAEMAALGLAGDASFAVNLCVEELFLNAVKHGRADRATISLSNGPGGLKLEFADDGHPFDPTEAPVKRLEGPGTDFEVGGFGAGLVQKFSRRVTYRRSGGMNRLVLEFDAGAGRGSDTEALDAG